jgi:4-amino-4-deoxy-L-arabinose transferase-like glycosyltransferase
MNRSAIALITLLAVGLLWRLIIASLLPPGYDEAYYYVYTLYPSWSYFDHPPLVGLVTAIGIWLSGGAVTQLSIRLGGVLLYTGTLYLLYLTGLRLFGRRAAWITLAIATFIPFFQVGFGVLILPDSPLLFFSMAAVYVAACEFFPIRYCQLLSQSSDTKQQNQSAEDADHSNQPLLENQHDQPGPQSQSYQPTYRIALIGLLVGLACLSKYHGFVFGLGLTIFCLLSPNHRRVFWSPWLLAAMALFMLAIAPMLFWNYQYDWASFRFQGARAVPQAGYNLTGLLVTFLAGVGYLFPSFGLPLWWVSLRSTGRVWRSLWLSLADWLINIKIEGIGDRLITNASPSLQHVTVSFTKNLLAQQQLLILCVALPIFLGFTLMGGYRLILPSWHMPGFFIATLLLGRQMAIAFTKRPKLMRRWLWGSAAIVTFLLMIALSHVSIGAFQKGGKYALIDAIPRETDASTQLFDVQQLRQAFQNSPQLQELLDQSAFVFTNNLFITGQVAMALVPISQQTITCFDDDLRGFAYWEAADTWLGKDGIYITSEEFWEPPSKYADYFRSISQIAMIPIDRGGQPIQQIYVFKGERLLKPYPRPYGKDI